MQRLAVVIPVHDEETLLPVLFARLQAVFARSSDLACEVLLVDDGSTDTSWDLIVAMGEADPRFHGLRLTRYFGHQLALTAGLDHLDAAVDAVVVMDADLQDPPELIPDLVARWRAGPDLVYGQRVRRNGDGWFKRASASAFYKLMGVISRDPTPDGVGDFYLLSQRALERLQDMRERHRYLRGMVFWLGYPREGVPYERQARGAGRTKFGLARMVRFALDGAVSSSTLPLTLASWGGLMSVALGLLLGAWVLVEQVRDPSSALGWAATPMVVLFLGGVQLFTVGILGLYVGRIYDETRGRPLYVVDQEHHPQPEQPVQNG